MVVFCPFAWGAGVTETPSNYRGQGFSPRGDKNRFVLPTAFRAAIREASGGQPLLCLDKHHKFPCLVGFGLSRVETFADLLDREEAKAIAQGTEFDRDTRSGQLYAYYDVGFDDSGRFILNDTIAEQAKVTDALYFNGGGDQITIWAPEVLFTMDAGWDSAKAKCRALMSEAAAKAKRK